MLYEFCRYVDDIADKNSDRKKIKLENIFNELNENFRKPNLHNINFLLSNRIIQKHHIFQLIEGIKLDLKSNIRIENEKELICYAYLVAGTVGLMMADILNVKNTVAYKYALDLGIALQLTNIARDILEDAQMNRIYLPKEWAPLTIDEIKFPSHEKKEKLKEIIRKTLDLSEKYYSSAIKGLGFLKLRNRFAILVALWIYRQIGIKILRRNFSNLHKREKVNFLEKAFCLLKCLFLFGFKVEIHKKDYNHNKSLHKHIRDIVIIKKKYEA